MPTKPATKSQARQVHAALIDQYADVVTEGWRPELRDRRPYDGQSGWQIHWEGGPPDWTYNFPAGCEEYRVPEVDLPPGVWVGAINHWSVAVYREVT